MRCYHYRVLLTDHIIHAHDSIELVPLDTVFNNSVYKKVLYILNPDRKRDL